MSEKEQEWNGGKFPNRDRRGLALSEFVEVGANNTGTSPNEAPPEVLRHPSGAPVDETPRSFGSAALLLPIAGVLAGIAAAFGIFVFMRPRRKRDLAPYDEYGTRRVSTQSERRPSRYLQRL